QNQFLILLQLVFAGIVIILLDEMLQKNWGLGSGISLFIAAGVAQTVVWSTFAPIPGNLTSDGKYLGAVIAFAQASGPLLQNLFSFNAWYGALYRGGNLPDMLGLIATVSVFLIVIYLNGLRVQIPVSYARYRGYRGKFPIKLFYVSNIPVIFAAALFGNVYFIGQLVFQRYNAACSNFWLNLIPGCYAQIPNQQKLQPYIPTVTILGAIVIGCIAVGADFLGAFGTGTGILLTVGIVEQYYQILVKERITEIYPGMKAILGT